MLDGVGTLIIFFFRNRDDFRNQSNIRILIRRNRLRRFRCRRDSDSDRRIGFRGDRDRYLTRHPRGGWSQLAGEAAGELALSQLRLITCD